MERIMGRAETPVPTKTFLPWLAMPITSWGTTWPIERIIEYPPETRALFT
jgi:hypothetical protein